MSSVFVLAQSNIPESAFWLAILVGAVAIVFFSFVLMLVKRYKRCPSNRVLVIFGKMTGSPAYDRPLNASFGIGRGCDREK